MFKKIILSLILLSNVIFAENDSDEDFYFKTINKFGQFIDEEGYIDYKSYYINLYPEDYPKFYCWNDVIDFYDKFRKGQKILKNWNNNVYDMWERNKEYLDDKGYINPEFIKNRERSLPNNKDDFIEADKNFREEKNNDFLALSGIQEWGEECEDKGYGTKYDWNRDE